uniref:SMP-30/gluconolactonase/LRE family protein n=1 Tax=Cupriavidus taiwanensis TaxID=164546 RepID=UPI0011C07BC3|nr:hypothetical protein [Cupriavidus taiwanensis]
MSTPRQNHGKQAMNRHTICAACLVALLGHSLPLRAQSAAASDRTVRPVVMAQQPAPSFLESIAVGPDRALYVTDFQGRQILKYVDDKGFSIHAQVDVHPWGMVFDTDGTLYFGAAEAGITDKTSPPTQWVYRQAPGDAPRPLLKVDQARSLNGMTLLAPGRVLIADGRGGMIWHLDVKTGRVSPFIRDDALDAPAGFQLPTPAANGLKLHRGHLYVSNTARATMLRIRIGKDLRPSGGVEVFAEAVRADDFVFSPGGNLYYTTHRKEVMKITPERHVSEVPGIGPELVGSTALAWRDGDDGPFAINDGGFIAHHWYGGPPPTASNLVRLGGLD